MTHENGCIELLDKEHLVNNDNMLQTIADEKENHIEVPSENRKVVSAGELFRSQEWINEKGSLPLMLGKSVDGKISILDLASAPNLLIAGCTGTGKSVLMDLCLFSLMFRHTPNDLKLILIDPKYVEYDRYKDLPYLKFPIINNTDDTHKVLLWLNKEIEHRYELLHEADCRDIQEMNRRKTASMPYIVIFINELADSMREARSQMESLLIPLCTRGRAIGIHFVISTIVMNPFCQGRHYIARYFDSSAKKRDSLRRIFLALVFCGSVPLYQRSSYSTGVQFSSEECGNTWL